MSQRNKQVVMMFQHAQKNPSFAVKLGMSLTDVDKVVTIGNAEGFNFTKEEFLGHLKAVANDGVKSTRADCWFGDGPTSSAMGEEDKKPRQPSGDGEYLCTMAIPEESKPRAPEKNQDDEQTGTTLALGEEDKKPRKPSGDEGYLCTLAIPEETKPRKPRTPREDFKDIRPTTLAVGEEDKKPRSPEDKFSITTHGRGEEDKKPRPPKKPEDDGKKKDDKPPRGRITTMAVGEEGRGPR